MLGLDRLKFDGNLLSRYDVGPKVDVTETAAADFAPDAVFIPDAKVLETQMSV